MADFSLTEEERAFKETVRKFAHNEVLPAALQADKMADPEAAWVCMAPVVQKGLQLGFGKIAIPEQYGGIGGGLPELFILAEELAAADSGFAMCMLNNAAIPLNIAFAGTEAQKEKWIRPAGEDETGRYIWAGAAVEPSGGMKFSVPFRIHASVSARAQSATGTAIASRGRNHGPPAPEWQRHTLCWRGRSRTSPTSRAATSSFFIRTRQATALARLKTSSATGH